MEQYTAYANYTIWFSDQTEYNAAVVLAGGNGFGHCPLFAALTFGIPWPLVSDPTTDSKGIYGSLPYLIPASPGPGFEVSHPNLSGVFLRSDLDNVIVPGQTANPPSGLIGPGPDMNLVWWGNIIFQQNNVGGSPPTTPIPERRWISGFETSGSGAEGGISFASGGGRAGSRTIDGLGYSLRGTNAAGSEKRTITDFRPGLNPKTSWERFYIRIGALGTSELIIWRAQGFTSSQEGATLRINTSGNLLLYNAWSLTTGPLMGTSSFPLTLNKWYLIDLLLTWSTNAGDVGRFRLYINHVLDVNGTINDGFGLDRLTYHVSSTLGQQSTAETLWEVDLDDWIGADVPNNGGVESLNSLDWLVGSHVRTVNVESGTMTDWTGHILMSNQYINANQPDSSAMVSSTALATIQGLTDATDEQITPGVVLGPVAAWIGAYVQASVSSTGRIGYKIAGGATVWNNVTDATSFAWVGYLYSQSGQPLPISITPFSILKEKSNDTNTYTIYALNAIVEYIGVWGIEDNPYFPLDISNNISLLLHNTRYTNTMFALGPYAGVPTAPCFTIGGTYVGNGTSTTITLPIPAHFIWIRGIAGPASSTSGCKWFGAGLGGHDGIQTQVFSNFVTRCWTDSAGLTKFTVTGNTGGTGEVNSNGLTYQYIAFCDPGMRFNYCGAYNVNNTLASAILPLFVTNFLADAGFIQQEILNSSGATNTLSYKGPGHAGVTGSLLTGVPITNWGSFAAGALTVLDDTITNTRNQTNFSLWRMLDPNGCLAIQITSYVGDGLAARTINLPYVTGRYPLLAIVIPHNSVVAYMRDPSHTGNDSCIVGTLINSTTAITGASAPDQINIGVTVNTVGVIYDVFVMMGSNTGWINGIFWCSNGPASGDWILPPYIPPNQPIITMNGGMDFNGSISLLAIENVSGIYTLVLNKLTDTIYDGLPGGTHLEVKIPDPLFKTGYIGG